MAGTAERMRSYQGPALLGHGFRPFFLLAALWACLAMILWIAMLLGHEPLPVGFDPVTWHAHEFLFGYLSAVIAGFVLTAVPNWTGRLPVMGWPLAWLAGLWIAGRAAVALASGLPWLAVMVVDLAMMVALLGFVLREVIGGRNWRNMPVALLIAAHAVGNLLFHVEAARLGTAYEGVGMRLGLASVLLLIGLIGGRIIPSFTRNWLAARGSDRLPVAFGRPDAVVMIATALALVIFVVQPEWPPLRAVMLALGAAHLWRMARWCGGRVLSEPLLWSLHLAYVMLALGFWAEAAAGYELVAVAGARHVWLAGTLGLMTLAVISRATLGHTGRPLHAGPGTAALYLALGLSVLCRLAAALPSASDAMLHASAGFWIASFAGFAVIYGPMLLRPRLAPRSPSAVRPSTPS